MKTSINAVFAGLVAVATAQIQLEVRFSDRMIDVGNVNLQEITRDVIYAEAGNQRSVLTDKTHASNNKNCKSELEGDDLAVQVKMNGAWGRTPGLGENDMRDGLIAAIFEVLTNVAAENAVDVYTECRGLVFQESVSYVPEAACGRLAAQPCTEVCKNDSASPLLTQCMKVSKSHRVPATMRVTAFIENALQPDDLIFEFSSQANDLGGGCGIVGDIAAKLAGFAIPVAGGFFADGITLACSS